MKTRKIFLIGCFAFLQLFLLVSFLCAKEKETKVYSVESATAKDKKKTKKQYYNYLKKYLENDSNYFVAYDYKFKYDFYREETRYNEGTYSLETVIYYYEALYFYLVNKDSAKAVEYLKKSLYLNNENYEAQLMYMLITDSVRLDKLEVLEIHIGSLSFYLLQARYAKRIKNFEKMNGYYKKAYNTSRTNDILKEWEEAKRIELNDIALKNGFYSVEEYENYQFRISSDNLIWYLQTGGYNSIPFKIGDVINIDYIDSAKLNIVDVQRQGGSYIYLVGFYRPESFSKCCYIISNSSSIHGSYKLKYIKDATYTVRNMYGIQDVNTYVFQMLD